MAIGRTRSRRRSANTVVVVVAAAAAIAAHTVFSPWAGHSDEWRVQADSHCRQQRHGRPRILLGNQYFSHCRSHGVSQQIQLPSEHAEGLWPDGVCVYMPMTVTGNGAHWGWARWGRCATGKAMGTGL